MKTNVEQDKLFRKLLGELIEMNDAAGGIDDIRANIRAVNKKWRKVFNDNVFIDNLFKRVPTFAETFKASEFATVN